MIRFAPLWAALLWTLVSAWPAFAQPVGAAARRPAGTPGAPAAGAQLLDRSLDYGQGIRIEGSPSFVASVEGTLDHLKRLPSGQTLVDQLGRTGHQTVIRDLRRRPISNAEKQNAYVEVLPPGQVRDAILSPDGRPGAGTGALVMWNPDFNPKEFRQPIILGHELLHALHVHKGEVDTTLKATGRDEGVKLEELRTSGLESYAQEPISENKLRREWNALHPEDPIPLRKGYRYVNETDAQAGVLRRDEQIADLEEAAEEAEAVAKKSLQEAAELLADGVSPKDPRVSSKLKQSEEADAAAKEAREQIAKLEREIEEILAQEFKDAADAPDEGYAPNAPEAPGAQPGTSKPGSKPPAKGLKQILEEALPKGR